MSFLKISVMKEWTEHTTLSLLPWNICSLQDYNWMMEFTENLLEHCAVSVNGTSDATLVKTKLALKRPMLKP
jgi:lysyl-tRNA synthetase class II